MSEKIKLYDTDKHPPLIDWENSVEIHIMTNSFCIVCNGRIDSGEKCFWNKGLGCYHLHCHPAAASDSK